MKKVLVYGLNNVRGGIEKYLLDMQQYLSSDVTFVYLVKLCDCIHETEIKKLGGEILFYPERNPLGNYISAIHHILKTQRNRCDTLYMNLSDLTFDNLIVMLLALRFQYRVVMHAHAAQLAHIPRFLHRCIHRFIVLFSKWIIRCFLVERYAVSDLAGEYLFGKLPYSIAAPGLDVGRFAFDSQKRQKIRQQLCLKEEYVYGFVGRLVEIKNPNYLLRTFYKINCKSTQSCRLLLVGDGPLLECLQTQVEQLGLANKVIFAGSTDDPVPYYHAMDYLILPSQSEGLSLVAIEAQAAGLPIACSAGRFPSTIALTPLLCFVPLEDGEGAWADACIAHGKRFVREDRKKWNHTMQESCFEMKKAAERLKQVLTASREQS